MHVHVQLFCDPMDCSLPGSSVYGISQARLLESFSLSAKFVISSVLSCCSKNLKWRTYSVTAPCCSSALFANKGKYILEVWGWANPKDMKRREAQSSILAPLFICFFLLPLSLPCVNWASQEGCLFYPRPSLQSWAFLCSIFTGFSLFVFQPLPFWTPFSYSNYLTLLQGIYLNKGWKLSLLHLLHWQADSLPLNYLGSPRKR